MVNVLVGNKNVREFDIACPKLANDKNYKIENVSTGAKTLIAYIKLKPDILVIDDSLTDISIEKLIDNLSYSPLEEKKCNTILTVEINNSMKLNNVTKIHTILYKPIKNNELADTIEKIAINYNTPDLEPYEVDELLENLEFNCMSSRL